MSSACVSRVPKTSFYMPLTRGKIPSALCHGSQIFVLTFSKTITGTDKDNGGDLTRA